MKRFFVALVCCLLFITLGSSVSARAEMEKDVKSKATELVAGKTVSGVLNSSDEVNWYRFVVKDSGAQQFYFKSSAIGASRFWMGIYIVDKDGVLQQAGAWKMNDGAEGNTTQEFSYEKGTVIYVHITNNYGYATGVNYSLTANTISEPIKNCEWAEKDADTQETANTLSSANRQCSVLNTKDDVDWYKYEVQNNKEFSFYIKSTGIGSSRYWMGIYVEDADGILQQVGAWKIADGADGYTSQKLSYEKGTKVYVHVTNNYGYATGVRYILAVNDTIDHSSEAKIAKVEDPISILAGTNVVVGKAEPGATVSVKYGKKTYKAVADDNGYYRVKTAKMSDGKTAQIWQTIGKKSSDKVKIKVVKTY